MVSEDDWQRLLKQSVPARIDYIWEDCWFEVSKSAEILYEIEDLMTRPSSRRPRSMLLIAESGMGKSTILDEVARRHPVTRDPETGDNSHPVLYVEMPSPGNVILFLQEMLTQAGCPVRYRRLNELKSFFLQQFKRLNTKIFLVDEAQRMALETDFVARHLCECIKWISTALQVPVVVTGTAEVSHLFERDSQLSSRFQRRELLTWRMDEQFQQFVCSILAAMPLRNGFDEKIYTSPEPLSVIHKAADGTTVGVFDYLRSRCTAALRRHQEYLALSDIVLEG